MLFIPDHKNEYRQRPISQPEEAPETLYLPLNGYRGELAPVVREGDSVNRYQLLAGSDGPFAGFIHAPVSGKTGSIIEIEGKKYLSLQNDFKNTEMVLSIPDVETISKEEILKTIRTYGIEGSGGARFPTALKLTTGHRHIDTLIINGAECEPFLTADYALMFHFADQLAKGIYIIQKVLQAPEIVIGIEKHNQDLKPILINAFRQSGIPLTVKLLPNSYPQGGELQLIKSVTGIAIPKGTIPAEHGVIVTNVGTVWAIFNAFYEGKPYVDRIVTLYDEYLQKGNNYLLPVGTPIQWLQEKVFTAPAKGNYIIGGPMMGRAVTDFRQPIHKGAGGVLHLKPLKDKINNCIACGYCADVCPQHLLPLEYARAYFSGNEESWQTYHLADCIECGACAYVCPSDVPLMQSIQTGKHLMR